MKRLILISILSFVLTVPTGGCEGKDKKDDLTPTRVVSAENVPPTGCKKYVGVDWLSSSHSSFPCEEALRVYEDVECPAFGTLWESFDDEYDGDKCLKSFLTLAAPKPHLVRIHISNEYGRIRENLAGYELLAGLSTNELNGLLGNRERAIIDYYREYVTDILENIGPYLSKNTRLMLSPGLEHGFDKEALETLRLLLRRTGYETVTNPMDGQLYNPGYNFIELHHAGNPQSMHLASMDGYDLLFPHRGGCCANTCWNPERIRDWVSQIEGSAIAVFLWSARSQGRCGDFGPPRSRTFEVSRMDILVMNEILREIDENTTDKN